MADKLAVRRDSSGSSCRGSAWGKATLQQGALCSLATLLLAELLDGDSVHIGDALFGEALAHGDGGSLLRAVLDLADELDLLENVKNVADVLSGAESRLLGLGAAASLATEVLTEALDATLLSHVELVADGGRAGVEPVVVKGSELAIAGSLNVFAPLLNIILIRTCRNRLRKRKRPT